MSSNTDIANLALGQLGWGKLISDLDSLTERSAEANACRLYYEVARQMIFKEFEWPFAGREVSLGLIEEFDTSISTTEWRYSYQYPSEALFFRRILTPYDRNTTIYTEIPYRIFDSEDGAGKLIYTDQCDAVGEYTANITDVDKFPADFKMAFAYLLAAYIAPMIINGDNTALQKKMWDLYQYHSTRATSQNANEEGQEPPPQSEFISFRNGGLSGDFWNGWRR